MKKGFFYVLGGNHMWHHLVVQTCNLTFFRRDWALMSHDLHEKFVCPQWTTSTSVGQLAHFQWLTFPILYSAVRRGLRSKEVSFVLLTQWPRVWIRTLPRFFHLYCLVRGQSSLKSNPTSAQAKRISQMQCSKGLSWLLLKNYWFLNMRNCHFGLFSVSAYSVNGLEK